MVEVWLAHPLVPTLELNPSGKARDAETHQEIYPSTDSAGYKSVAHRGRSFMLHRVIAETFLNAETSHHSWEGKTGRARQVRFRTADRSDCSVENLIVPGPPQPRATLSPPIHVYIILPVPKSKTVANPDPPDETLEALFALNPQLSEEEISTVFSYFYVVENALLHRIRAATHSRWVFRLDKLRVVRYSGPLESGLQI